MNTAEKVLAALAAFEVKDRGGGRYQSNSPLRPGSNSHAFSLVISDGEHGAYKDFVSGESGSLYDLAKRLGVDTGKETQSTKRPYSGMAEYARSHGVPADKLAAAGWREVVIEGRPAIEFPTRGGRRWRFLDGQKPHYKSERGYSSCWYGLDGQLMVKVFARAAQGHIDPVVICNGEISTLAARAAGLPACCVTAGEKAIPAHLLEEFAGMIDKDIPILIALDCDPAGRQAAALIMRQLVAAGYNARAVDLGLGAGGDLADFCMLYEAENAGAVIDALLALPTLAAPTQPDTSAPERNWRIVHASELKNLPRVSWLIDNEIPETGLTVLFGASGAGKSFLALDYALKIAQRVSVVYIAAEGELGYEQRIAAWKAHNHASEGNLYICLGNVALLDSQDMEEFLAQVWQHGPKLIVVDTLAMSMVGGDENSAKDIGLVLRACKRFQREIGAAVLVVHHVNKGGVAERGSSALRGAADVMIRIQADDDLIRVECSKTKDAAPFPGRYMRLLPVALPEFGEVPVIVPADRILESAQDKLTPNQALVLECLNNSVYAAGASAQEIEEYTHIPRGSMVRVLSRLLDMKLIIQPAPREPYTITETGLNRLNRLNRLNQGTAIVESPDQSKTGDSTIQPIVSPQNSRSVESVESPAYYQSSL